jgi:TolB-like protein
MPAAVPKSSRALATIFGALAAAGIAIWFFSNRAPLDPSQVKAILILPIDDGTQFRELEDYCEAVADTLVTSLGSAENPGIIATTTTAVYKTRLPELADIRDRTGADSILDGRMDTAGKQVKLSLRLRRASDGKTIWTDGFSAERTQLLASVDRLARALGQQLGRPVRSKPLAAVKDQSALDFYADARKRVRSTDMSDLNRAMTNLAKAQAISPDFAPIPASQVDLYGWATMLDLVRRDMARERIDVGAKAARAANADNPEAYFAEGALALAVDWKWSAAAESFKKALALRPGYVPAWLALGRVYQATGRLPEALDAMTRAHRLDPLGQTTTLDYGLALVLNGKYEEALRLVDRYLEIKPDVKQAAFVRALALFGKGDHVSSRGVMRSMLHLPEFKAPVYGLLVPAEARAGNVQEARRMLGELEKITRDPLMDDVILAGARLALGDEAKAFADLRSAVEKQATAMRNVEGNPLFNGYRQDPRMIAVLKQMRSPR